MPNKSSVGSQVLMFLEILRLIPRHRWISQTELRSSLHVRGFDVTELTLQRALKTLRENGDFGIECDTRTRPFGYRCSLESAFSLSKLTVQESLLLKLVEGHLRNQIPGALGKALEPLFDSAQEVLAQGGRSKAARDWLDKVAVVPNSMPFLPPSVKPRIFNAVTDALYEGKMVRIVYRKPGSDARDYVVSPLGLVQQDVRLYLVSQFEGYDNVRHLALHRMEDAEILARPSVLPAGFVLRDYMRSHHFNYDNSGRKIRLTLEITNPETIQNLSETPFSRTQVIEQTAPGRWRLTAEVLDSVLLDAWFHIWSEHAGITCVVKESLS